MKKAFIPAIVVNVVLIVVTVLALLNSTFNVLIYGYETGLILLIISIIITVRYALNRVIFEFKWRGSIGSKTSNFFKHLLFFIIKITVSYGIGVILLTYLFQMDYLYATYMIPVGLGILNTIDNIGMYKNTIDF